MPSGPKKRRAARKKNDTDPHQDDKLLVSADINVFKLTVSDMGLVKKCGKDFKFADQVTSETPLMDALLQNVEKDDKLLVSADINVFKMTVSDMGLEENCGKESKFADQITSETPLMDALLQNGEKGNEDDQVLESVVNMNKESVNDQIIVDSSLIDLISNKTEENKVAENEEDPLLDLQASLDSENVHEIVNVIESESEVKVKRVKELMEQLLRDSTEISLKAESVLSGVKNLSFYVSQLLEEVDSGKLI